MQHPTPLGANTHQTRPVQRAINGLQCSSMRSSFKEYQLSPRLAAGVAGTSTWCKSPAANAIDPTPSKSASGLPCFKSSITGNSLPSILFSAFVAFGRFIEIPLPTTCTSMAPQAAAATSATMAHPSATSAPTGSNTSHKPFVPIGFLIFLSLCLAYTFSYLLYRYIMAYRRGSQGDTPDSPDRGVSKFMSASLLSWWRVACSDATADWCIMILWFP
jgi:hypothetical protein